MALIKVRSHDGTHYVNPIAVAQIVVVDVPVPGSNPNVFLHLMASRANSARGEVISVRTDDVAGLLKDFNYFEGAL